MKYAIRLTRDNTTNAIAVHPITRVRDSVKPYRIKYDAKLRCTETLRLFDTREEAETAFAEEQIAAGLSVKTSDELLTVLRSDLDTLKRGGFPLSLICKLIDARADCVRAYINKSNPPNPRIVAKIHLMIPLIREFQDRVWKVLPLREDVGGRKRSFPRAKKYL